MIKEFCLAWEKNKGKLEEYFRTAPQSEYYSYELLVRRLFDIIIINPSIEDSYYWFDTKKFLRYRRWRLSRNSGVYITQGSIST